MSQEILSKYYGIQVERAHNEGSLNSFVAGNSIYTIHKVTNMEEQILQELYMLSEHLRTSGDRYVSSFVPTEDGKYLVTEEEQDYVVLHNQMLKVSPQKLGRKLARFHVSGRTVQQRIEKINRIGQWKQLWEQRVNQLESVYRNVVTQHPSDEFERLFVESFPYYMGLSENAIQYLVDTELDDEPREHDAGTVCHERFHSNTWGKNVWMHNPFQWVFDHGSRDVAEWVRDLYDKRTQTFHHDLKQFVREYQSVTPLSSFSWRLLYSRLVFPLHYFQCIEDYYITTSEQQKHVLSEKLQRILQTTHYHERFLTDFYQLCEVPINRLSIPKINWLS